MFKNTLCSDVRLKAIFEIATKERVKYVLTRARLEALENSDILTYANFGKRIRYYGFKESGG
jgi:hypothetical protein